MELGKYKVVFCELISRCIFENSHILVPERISFSGEEEKIAQYWEKIDAFKTSIKKSEGKPIYSFYDGPPFATGLPHYGHILAGTIKVNRNNPLFITFLGYCNKIRTSNRTLRRKKIWLGLSWFTY